jgi:hypothetical protein
LPQTIVPIIFTNHASQAMKDIPQELIDQICGHLSAADLQVAYYVSTKFRRAAEDQAERHRHESFDLTEENTKTFIAYYSGFRLRYLEYVYFDLNFPDPNSKGYGCRESIAEQHERDEVLTEQLCHLFETLAVVEELAGNANLGRYKLTIDCVSPAWIDDVCIHRMHAQWRTHLLSPQTLPNAASVCSFRLKNADAGVKLDYRIVVDLLAHLPNVEYLDFQTGAGEWYPSYEDIESTELFQWDYDGTRRDTRHGLREAVQSLDIPSQLKQLELDFFCPGAREAMTIHHYNAQPNLVSPASRDPFSTSLRILSYHLQEICLRVQADDSLFWPDDGSTPTWPHLQRVFIMFHMVAPSGAWYFDGPKGEGGELIGYELDDSAYAPVEVNDDMGDPDCEDVTADDLCFDSYSYFNFRVRPNNEVLRPFLSSFAKAAANMPDLRQAILWSPLKWNIHGGGDDYPPSMFDYFAPPESSDLAWGLAYYVPTAGGAFRTNPGEACCKTRQIWWKVGEWRPDLELHASFQEIGRTRYGKGLKEHWEDDAYGTGLVPADMFNFWTPET